MNKNRIVYTAGTFDVFHFGHVRLLKRAREIADGLNAFLLVGISTDKLVESYKGRKPAMNYDRRAEIVGACKYVDLIVKQHELIDIKILKKYKPDVIVTAFEWRFLDGIKWAKKNGIKVVYVPYTKGISSSSIIKGLLI